MSTNTNKTPVDYYEFTAQAETPFVVLEHREGRFPIKRSLVTPAGAIEITGSDGAVEVLGSAENPCSMAILKRIRTHHEGLLVVQVDVARIDGVSEQVLTARFH